MGMPADKAYKRAAEFVSFHYAFDYSIVSRILERNGAVIGYEVRPFYRPSEFGYSNALDVLYTPEDGKVRVAIHLKPAIEQYLRDGDGRRPFLFRMR